MHVHVCEYSYSHETSVVLLSIPTQTERANIPGLPTPANLISAKGRATYVPIATCTYTCTCTCMCIVSITLHVPYSGKPSREKTFVDQEKVSISQRKPLQNAEQVVYVVDCCGTPKISWFVQVFSHKSFPLYIMSLCIM